MRNFYFSKLSFQQSNAYGKKKHGFKPCFCSYSMLKLCNRLIHQFCRFT